MASSLPSTETFFTTLNGEERRFLDELESSKLNAVAYQRIEEFVKSGALPVVGRRDYKAKKEVLKPRGQRLKYVEGPLTTIGTALGCMAAFLASQRLYQWAGITAVFAAVFFAGAGKAGNTEDMKQLDRTMDGYQQRFNYFIYVDDKDGSKQVRLYRSTVWTPNPKKDMGRAQLDKARIMTLAGDAKYWKELAGQDTSSLDDKKSNTSLSDTSAGAGGVGLLDPDDYDDDGSSSDLELDLGL